MTFYFGRGWNFTVREDEAVLELDANIDALGMDANVGSIKITANQAAVVIEETG